MSAVKGVAHTKNLITKLNTIGQTRKSLLDQLWILENEGEKLRVELLEALDHKI